ncbi:hypothetical protein ACFL35_08020 [Candidatus Riflebacteria bacterium]
MRQETLALKFKLEDRELIVRFASLLRVKRLVIPAIFMLEMHKPFAFLISSFLVFLEPIILMFFKIPEYRRLTELAENRDTIEYLIRCLEDDRLFAAESESVRNFETECPHESN